MSSCTLFYLLRECEREKKNTQSWDPCEEDKNDPFDALLIHQMWTWSELDEAQQMLLCLLLLRFKGLYNFKGLKQVHWDVHTAQVYYIYGQIYNWLQKMKKQISILRVFCLYVVDASVRCGTSSCAGGGGSSHWLVVSESAGSGLDWGSSVDGPGVWVQLICSMTMGGGWGWNDEKEVYF